MSAPLIGVDVRRTTLWPQTGIARYSRNLLRSIGSIAPQDLDVRAIDVRGSSSWAGALAAGRGTPAPRRAFEEQLPMAAMTRRMDVLHLPWSEGPAWPLCPLVITLHDLAIVESPSAYEFGFRAYYVSLVGIHVRRAAAVIVPSQATLEAARRRWGRRPYRLIPQAADQQFHADGSGSLTDEPTVLYTGGYDARKRVPDLVAAVALLRRSVADVRLVMSGEPPERIQALARAQLGSQVTLTGYLSDGDLAEWYRRAWAVAYPTDMEGFGFPIVEAFASGTPVVATRAGSVAEIAGEAALLVDRGNVPELADALGQVIGDGALRASLRGAGLERAAQFSWEQTALKTLDVYREVIG